MQLLKNAIGYTEGDYGHMVESFVLVIKDEWIAEIWRDVNDNWHIGCFVEEYKTKVDAVNEVVKNPTFKGLTFGTTEDMEDLMEEASIAYYESGAYNEGVNQEDFEEKYIEERHHEE